MKTANDVANIIKSLDLGGNAHNILLEHEIDEEILGKLNKFDLVKLGVKLAHSIKILEHFQGNLIDKHEMSQEGIQNQQENTTNDKHLNLSNEEEILENDEIYHDHDDVLDHGNVTSTTIE